MKNKKGFTLVELIAVIALLAAILLIVMPNIVRTFDNGKVKAFATLVQDVYRQAEKDYAEDYAFNEERNAYCDSDSADYLYDEYGIECKPLKYNDETAYYYITLDNRGKVSSIMVGNEDYCYVPEDDPNINIDMDDIIQGYSYYDDEIGAFQCSERSGFFGKKIKELKE